MIELYACHGPNVRKVLILLEELGLDYQVRPVAVMNSGQFAPDFLALNPFARVPVLVDDAHGLAQPIFESGAILIYLAEAYGNEAFYPATGDGRYAALKWLMVQMASVGPMFGQYNHFIMTPDESRGYAATRYREQAAKLYGILDERLAQVPWLAGDDYSIADMATYPWALYVTRHRFAWSDFSNLHAWTERIRARPAVVRADQVLLRIAEDEGKEAAHATQEDYDRLFRRAQPGPRTDTSPLALGEW